MHPLPCAPTKVRDTAALVVVLFMVLSSCATGATFRPTAHVAEPDDRAITDEDIRRAFEAAPQLRFPTRIAYYDLGTDQLSGRLSFPESLVAGSYHIPKALVEGLGPRDDHAARFRETKPLGIKSLRLLAARSRSDLLVVTTSEYVRAIDYNWMSIFNILILPCLFTPHVEVRRQYWGEVMVFDVRNGYLYLHARHDSGPIVKTYQTVWSAMVKDDPEKDQLAGAAARYLGRQVQTLFEEAASGRTGPSPGR